MSQENVEIIKAGLAAVGRRDVQGVQAVFHPDAEFRTTMAVVGEDVYRGTNLAADWLGDIYAVFENYRVELEAVLGEGDRLVIAIRNLGQGKTSGAPLEDRRYVALTFRGGVVWRAQSFAEKQAALEAVGLGE
jgi:ketosteroid isomerase-like protein